VRQAGAGHDLAGNAIGFAMECFEKGLLTAGELEGLELRFGDDEACLAAIEMIAERRGFGDVLAQGIRAAAARIGHGSESFAMQVKGWNSRPTTRGAPSGGALLCRQPARGLPPQAWPPPRRSSGGPPYTVEGKGR